MSRRPLRRRHPRVRVAALACVAALTASGCAHHKERISFGLRRVAVDLAFKDETKAKPPTVQQVLAAPQEAVPPATFASVASPAQVSAPGPAITVPTCKTAAPTARPQASAPVVVSDPPKAGLYKQHNTGTFNIMAGTLRFNGPYPALSSMIVSNVRTTTNAGVGTFTAETKNVFFDVTQQGNGAVVITSYEATPTELDLLRVEQHIGSVTTTFKPTPPITVMQFKDVSAQWSSAGIDTDTGTAMVVQSQVVAHENVDVCGTVYDAYKVVSSEHVVNPQTGYESQTDPNDPNVYDVATQFGGIFIRQHVHTSTAFTANNAPVQLDLNYTSTVDSVTPTAVK